jgi:Zn-dependent protease with chaperone function
MEPSAELQAVVGRLFGAINARDPVTARNLHADVAGVTFIGFWAANWALHYSVDRWHMFETISDFANLPLLILIFSLLSFFLMPALNAFSRYNERQADRYAFESIASVAPFVSSMNKLAEQNLAERTPSRWVEWWFHSHPAIARRVAAAEAWEKATG